MLPGPDRAHDAATSLLRPVRMITVHDHPRTGPVISMARYLVGIDLGTTNSALAAVDLDRTPRATSRVNLNPFPVPQLVAPGEMKDRSLLPSFLYLPGPHDLPAGSTALPWDPNRS